MPKKHAPSYTHTKPSYVHPSLQSSRSSASTTPAAPQTVNERIQQLRREQTPRVSQSRRDEVTEVVSQRTIPPHLRRILNMAEIDPPPKPRHARIGNRTGRRPPPGPAAPSSWLRQSRHAPDHVRNIAKYWKGGGTGPQRFCKLTEVHNEDYQRLPPARSLVHHSLKTLAIHWEDLVEYEQHYLPELPTQLKEALLSYLSIYDSQGCLDMRSIKILFNPEVKEGGSSEDVKFLDLTGLVCDKFPLSDLFKVLVRPVPRISDATNDLAHLSLDSTGILPKSSVPIAELAESWEDAVDDAPSVCLPHAYAVSLRPSIPHFSNLTRLSLAHPGGGAASWPALLDVSRYLNTLTHLSLAYWPIPSMTPNAGTTSMVSNLTNPVALGGSHFYSELDNDWHEAANILRRLSKNTYCLKWLDLEGCAWAQALTWTPGEPPPYTRARRARGLLPQDAWERTPTEVGPDFNDAWRQISYINLFQGCMPKDLRSVTGMPAGHLNMSLLMWLREHEDDPEYADKWADVNVYDWVEREKSNNSVGREIWLRRKDAKGAYVDIDFGWKVGPRIRKGDEDEEA